MSNHLSHIALTGATGNIGRHILPALLSNPTFATITVLTRPDSDVSSLPQHEKLRVQRAGYDDHAALVQALTGAHALIITMGIGVKMEVELALIDAAVEAGCQWILPNEYGSDNANPVLYTQVPPMAEKRRARDRVEERAQALGKPTKWVGVVTNAWYAYCLQHTLFGINLPRQHAQFFSHGLTKTYITTAAQVGRAVAALLALPITAAPSPSPSATSLNDYANAFIYVKSFLLSQRDVLDAVQRATQTSDAEWTVENMDVDTAIEVGREVWRGEGVMHPYLLFGNLFKAGNGGQYEGREVANDKLGLPVEDLDAVTRAAVGV